MQMLDYRHNEKTQSAFDSAFQYKSPEELTGVRVIGHAGKPSGQGPYIELFLSIERQKILDATFRTYGCPGLYRLFASYMYDGQRIEFPTSPAGNDIGYEKGRRGTSTGETALLRSGSRSFERCR